MILRLSSGAERAIAAIAALFLAFLAFFSVRDALADYFAGQETLAGLTRATHLEPENPDNWFALGRYWQYNLESFDLQRAVAAYRKALSLNPKSADVWLDLAAAEEALGNTQAACEAFANARRAYPLSAQVAWSYGNFLLRHGDLNQAFAEIRRAVIAEPRRGGEAFSRCIRVEPDIDKILDRVIPPSPVAYLEIVRILADENQARDALRVWDRLIALRPQLQLRFLWQLMDSLRRNHLIRESDRVWRQAAALSGYASFQDPPGSVLWDGGFESGEAGLAYSWNFSSNAHGVQIRVQSQEKRSGAQALRVTFDGQSNLNFRDVCHLVAVEAATAYQFSAWVRTRDISTDQGVHFTLNALNTSQDTPLVTRNLVGNLDWQQIGGEWTSPAGSSEAQVCLVRFPSDQADNKIRGTVWVDDVALVPVANGNANR